MIRPEPEEKAGFVNGSLAPSAMTQAPAVNNPVYNAYTREKDGKALVEKLTHLSAAQEAAEKQGIVALGFVKTNAKGEKIPAKIGEECSWNSEQLVGYKNSVPYFVQ